VAAETRPDAKGSVHGRSRIDEVRARHPPFWSAVIADAQIRSAYNRQPFEMGTRTDTLLRVLRLIWASDAFLAQVLYRLKCRLQAAGVPVLPSLLRLLARMIAQLEVGDEVVIEPGVQIAHGQVSIGGFTVIRSGTTVAPFVSIGLRSGTYEGPMIEQHVEVGTGARILGPVHVGAHARIGANAVVTTDVEAGTTVVGVPARPR
jgi:serine O-acetyltransferase